MLGGGAHELVLVGLVVEARLEHRPQRVELAPGGPSGARRRLRVAVPGAREADEAGAAAVAVRGEHRADAARAVGIGADDDVVSLEPLEHGAARGAR